MVLDKAGEDLVDFEFAHAERLADARKAVANAEVGLDDAREELADFYLDYAQELATARQAKGDAEVALEKAEDTATDYFFSLGQTVVFDEDAVEELARLRAAEALARANLNKARDDLARLEPGADSRKLQQLESAVEAAKAKLDGALQDLRVLEEGHEAAARQQLEAAMELAQINLTKAQDDLADLGNEPARLELHDLEADVEQSLASLAKAQDDLAELAEGPDPLERLKLQATAQMAMATLAQAEDDLKELLDGPDLQELALREKRVAKQRERLVELTDGPEVLEVALREAQVATAQAVLKDALEDLQGASITAPFAGVISLVNVEVDDEVDDESRVIEIVDPTAIQVNGFVDAADIQFVRKGSMAKVTIDALPGQVLEVTVSSVAAEPRTERGVVRYPVTISFELPEGVEVPVGLSGVSSVVLYEEKGVLSVPQGALYRTSKQTMVRVMNDGFVEERAVILGDGDGSWVEVLQGLEEGDQVVVDTARVASTRIGLR
ncbi:MAG: HlyD family efflux transporter periplasmic adaptor subunit [Acidobacteria bacterium]|nr:HlyD family efflux transporter periplasmic adaptor subunit [Acidobacteriota bacterium]